MLFVWNLFPKIQTIWSEFIVRLILTKRMCWQILIDFTMKAGAPYLQYFFVYLWRSVASSWLSNPDMYLLYVFTMHSILPVLLRLMYISRCFSISSCRSWWQFYSICPSLHLNFKKWLSTIDGKFYKKIIIFCVDNQHYIPYTLVCIVVLVLL